jgi:hypothetical protein
MSGGCHEAPRSLVWPAEDGRGVRPQLTIIGGVGAYQGRNPASSRSAQDRFQTLRGNHHAVPA